MFVNNSGSGFNDPLIVCKFLSWDQTIFMNNLWFCKLIGSIDKSFKLPKLQGGIL